jgi:hypothetical protein
LTSPDTAIDNDVQVASLLDVAGCKMAVVQRCAEARDNLDIAAFLENGISLPKALSAAKAIYGNQFEPTTMLRALSYFADGDLPKLHTSMQNALRTAAIGVKLDELPVPSGRRDLTSHGKDY